MTNNTFLLTNISPEQDKYNYVRAVCISDMDERFIYIPPQSPTPSSPDDIDEEQCLFDDLPFPAYGKEEEVEDTASQIDAATQASISHWPPDIKSEKTVASEVIVDKVYFNSGEKKVYIKKSLRD